MSGFNLSKQRELYAAMSEADKHMLRRISAFDRYCHCAQYTDVGGLWDLMYDTRNRLKENIERVAELERRIGAV